MKFLALYLQSMENTIQSLKIRCIKAGTNLTRVCEQAGVDRNLVSRWAKEEPKSFQILRKLDQALKTAEIEAQSRGTLGEGDPREYAV